MVSMGCPSRSFVLIGFNASHAASLSNGHRFISAYRARNATILTNPLDDVKIFIWSGVYDFLNFYEVLPDTK